MSEGSKERSPQQLAKSRRDYLAQVKMLTVDERTQEAAKINKALGIKAPKGTAAAATLDAARGAYIRLLGSVGSNAEVKAEVTCFCEQLDQMQLRMLDAKPRKRRQHLPRQLTPAKQARWEVSDFILATFRSFAFSHKLDPKRPLVSRTAIVVSPCSFARRVVMQCPNQLGVVTSGGGRQCDGASSSGQ